MKMTTGKWLGATILAGMLGLAIPVAYSHNDDGPRKEHCMRGDMAQRFEQRQTELHDKLKLTTEQETAWKTFTGKLIPPSRPNRDELEKDQSLPAPERMEAMLTRLKEHQEQLATNLAAVKEFYGVLTPEQKKVFDSEFGPHGRHHRHQQS